MLRALVASIALSALAHPALAPVARFYSRHGLLEDVAA